MKRLCPPTCGLLLALSAIAALSPGCNKAPKYETVTRPAFSIDLPQWPAVIKEGNAGQGKYKVMRSDNRASAEASWQGGTMTKASDMSSMLDALTSGFAIDKEGAAVTASGKDHESLTASGSIKEGKVWLKLTMISCQKTKVLVTFGVTAADKSLVETVHSRAMKTFKCIGESPKDFAPAGPPRSTLTELGFTLEREGETFFFSGPNETAITVITGPTDILKGLTQNPDLLLQTLAKLSQRPMTLKSELTSSLNDLDGKPMTVVDASIGATQAPILMAGLGCPSAGVAYVLIAEAPAATPRRKLRDLLKRVGCPK